VQLILLWAQPVAAKAAHERAKGQCPSLPEMAALTKLNDKFRLLYGEAKANVLSAQSTPVIICYGDHMELIFGDRRDQICVHSRLLYTALKVIDHIPLAIFSLLQDNTDKPSERQSSKADLSRDLRN
jgi:hypothetical protein